MNGDLVNLSTTDESVSVSMDFFPNVRKVALYCMALFNIDTGNARVFTFLNSDKCLEFTLIFRGIDNGLYIDTFSRILYVTKGHPLYNYGQPVVRPDVKPLRVKLK